MSFAEFGLRQDPFNRATPPRHPFMSGGYRRAIDELYYHLENGPPILGVVSASGVGRTTLLRQLESRMRASSSTLFLSPACCHLEEAMRFLGARRAIADQSRQNGHGRETDPDGAIEIKPSGGIVLFVDDAQNLDHSARSAMRSLMRAAARMENRVIIVVGGSPEIADRLIGDDLRQNFHGVSLAPLAPAEVEPYIAHRLRLIGWRGPTFSPRACEAIGVLSDGVCAKINDLCSAALLTAAERGLALIDASLFPASASKLSASAIAKAPSDGRERGSRLALAIPACAIASFLFAGLWYELDQGPRSIATPHMMRSQSDDRIDDSSARKPLGNLPESDAPDIAIAAKMPPIGIRPSSSRAGIHADARTSSPAPASSAVSVAARVSTPAPANVTAAQRVNPRRDAQGEAIAKAVVPPSAIAASRYPTTSAPAAATFGIPTPTNREGQSPVTPAADSRVAALALEQASFETGLGDAYMRLGEYDNAIRSFQIAVGLTPGNQEIEQRIVRARRAKAAEQSILR